MARMQNILKYKKTHHEHARNSISMLCAAVVKIKHIAVTFQNGMQKVNFTLQDAIKTQNRRRGIALTILSTMAQNGVSGQHHAPATLPLGKKTQYPQNTERVVGLWASLDQSPQPRFEPRPSSL
jgi:hypothetical protein